MNQVILTGRLSHDPELLYSKEGYAVTTFQLAVKRNYKNPEGNYDADFIRCVAFRKTAENVASFCDKGSHIAVIGRLQTRSYENKDKLRVFVTEVIVDSIEFIQSKQTAPATT